MENCENAITCTQCNTGLPSGAKNCYKCGAVIGSPDDDLRGVPEAPKSTVPSPQNSNPTVFSEVSEALHRAENEIPWNGIFLGMAFLFLLITYFNK